MKPILLISLAPALISLACCDDSPKRAPSSVTVEVVSYSGGSWGQYTNYTRIITDTKTGRRFLVTDGHSPVEMPNTKP